MKAKGIGLVIVAAAIAAACGEGRAIFNVDVFSFMSGTGDDTLHYGPIPITGAATVDKTPVQFQLLGGLGNSTVDTVTITLGANLDNAAGSGSDSIFIFFAADSASTYLGQPFFKTGGTVAPATITPVSGSISFTDSLFNSQNLWVGVRLKINVTAAPLEGTMRLTIFNLRIVLQDKF